MSSTPKRKTVQLSINTGPPTEKTPTKSSRKGTKNASKISSSITVLESGSLTAPQSLESCASPPTPTTPSSSSSLLSRKRKSRTVFPVAKIKRIMQADENIGKISTTVPVMISKCLELFLRDLVVRTEAITKVKKSKTMSTLHLKECVEGEKMFDFLQNLVKEVKVVEEKKRARKSKEKHKQDPESEEEKDEEEEEEEEEELERKSKKPRRSTKKQSDNTFTQQHVPPVRPQKQPPSSSPLLLKQPPPLQQPAPLQQIQLQLHSIPPPTLTSLARSTKEGPGISASALPPLPLQPSLQYLPPISHLQQQTPPNLHGIPALLKPNDVHTDNSACPENVKHEGNNEKEKPH